MIPLGRLNRSKDNIHSIRVVFGVRTNPSYWIYDRPTTGPAIDAYVHTLVEAIAPNEQDPNRVKVFMFLSAQIIPIHSTLMQR